MKSNHVEGKLNKKINVYDEKIYEYNRVKQNKMQTEAALEDLSRVY